MLDFSEVESSLGEWRAESSLDVEVRHLYVGRTAWMSRSDTLDVVESSLDVAVRLETMLLLLWGAMHLM